MITRVTKQFEFEAAHRLSDYEGKCKRVHGHNYKGIVTVEGNDNQVLLNGILVDFGDIKEAVKTTIVNLFDHRLILNSSDPYNQEIAKVLKNDDVIWVNYNPTAESLAQDFLARIKKMIPQAKSVELFETPDSSAIAE